MISLYIYLFPISDSLSRQEILSCIQSNICNSHIDRIVVLNEGFDHPVLNEAKIVNIPFDRRPEFSDFDNYLLEGSINIVANNDIRFDNTLSRIKWLLLKKGDLLSLTRRESDGKLLRVNDGDSQDAWIFLGKPHCLKSCNFFMGLPGCDGRINFIFYNGGYRVLNPSKFIHIYHEHHSLQRNYDDNDRVEGNYLICKPIHFFAFHWYRIQLYFIQTRRINIFS